ncbi:hypothetical protein MXB_5116 [Myxobolus squamalis]|nr:hypothetical protein MXB_5116 [Myxobolus squamalis]
MSQKFNIKFDIKINDFLTFDENYLIEKVVDAVEAILHYDKSDTISPISIDSIDLNLSPQAHQDLQSLQGAITSTPQKLLKKISQISHCNDKYNFLTINTLRIKKIYFIQFDRTKKFEKLDISMLLVVKLVNPTNVSECSLSKCHILIHDSIDTIDKIKIISEELSKFSMKKIRKLSFRENYFPTQEISLIDVNQNYIKYLIHHDLINTVNELWALINKISNIFDQSEIILFNHVKELNRLVYHNSLNLIDVDQVLAPSFMSQK